MERSRLEQSEPKPLTLSESFAETNSFTRSNNLLSFVADNIGAPLGNSALVDPYNALASSLNDASATVGGGKLLTEAKPFEVPRTKLMSQEWLVQSVSTGIGAIVPLVVSIGVTKVGLTRLAGNSESAFAGVLRHRTTATVMGAGIYDGLKMPHQGETRIGNGIGGSSGFLVFEAGNHLSKNFSPAGKVATRLLTGAIGATTHLGVAELVGNGKLPELRKVQDGALAGSAMNVFMPFAMGKIFKSTNAKSVETERVVPPGTSAAVEETVPISTLSPRRSQAVSSLVDAHGRPLRLSSEDPTALATTRIPSERLFTSQHVSEDGIFEFGSRIERALERFRSSDGFDSARADYRALARRFGNLGDRAQDLLDRVNRDRPLATQLLFDDMRSSALESAVGGNPRLKALYQGIITDHDQVRADARKTLRSGEFGAVRRDLHDAVLFLGDEMGIPRLGFGLKKLEVKTSGVYRGGVGSQFLQPKVLFNTDSAEVAAILGHETSHGLQDYILMSSLADRARIRFASPAAVQLMQRECEQACGYTPKPSWMKAVLSMRGGVQLTDKQSAFARELLADAKPTDGKTRLHSNAMRAVEFLENPYVEKPVASLISQLNSGLKPAEVFPMGKVPAFVVDLQARWRRGLSVDNAADTAKTIGYFEDLSGKLEDVRYSRYRLSYPERDAWGFEDKVREIVRVQHNDWDVYGADAFAKR